MSEKVTGVFCATKKDGTTYYRSSITYKRKHISLGSFPTVNAASKAYETARSLLDTTSFSIADYHTAKTTLSFEKWVSVINLRDNGIYFSNPIYIRPKFFYYYLSENDYLTFDTDDLFYYSSHKIMQRGNHLFVADFGMQTNILNRYGIRSFAVCDRDYKFMNGDRHDFRYENVHIINKYYGVTAETKKDGSTAFLAKIHINGDYRIGIYETEAMAAIAYNKAIDTLKKKGCRKNYTPNYLDISNALYADIYASVTISKKLEELTFQ